MDNLGASIGWGLVVGASLLLRAVAAARFRLPSRFAATLTAFGGGILVAAVALELVPDADAAAGTALAAAGLIGGTLVYVAADAWLNRKQGMMSMRRSAHAAAAGRPMASEVVAPDGAEATRGESSRPDCSWTVYPSPIPLGLTIAEEKLGVALLAGILIGNVRNSPSVLH